VALSCSARTRVEPCLEMEHIGRKSADLNESIFDDDRVGSLVEVNQEIYELRRLVIHLLT